MTEYSEMSSLDIWYQRVDFEYLIGKIKKPGRRQSAIENLDKLKEKRSHVGALNKLTVVVDGKRKIRDMPPLVYHTDIATDDRVKMVLKDYAKTLWESKQTLLQRYRYVDIAAKVVGVGSVGTAAAIVLLKGEGGDDDYVFLQVKEASRSVLEDFIGKSQFSHPGQRIVNGQRLLQSASDMFLGWTSGPVRDFYVRQLMDVKKSVPIDELDATSLEQYAGVCGLVLARAHARTGDPAMISGYLGTSDTFDEALVAFSNSYRKQNQLDYLALLEAVSKGEIKTDTGV